jgi:transcriptional regulator NrdR family protein
VEGKRVEDSHSNRWKSTLRTSSRSLVRPSRKCQSSKSRITTAEALEAHFKKLVQEFGKQYFGRKAAEDQKGAMENGELTYEGHDHFSVAERLFRINDQLEYLGPDVEKFSEKEMAKKVIAKTLHPNARLEYIRRGGGTTSKQEILTCV